MYTRFYSLRSLNYKIPGLDTDLFAVCKSSHLLLNKDNKTANIF